MSVAVGGGGKRGGRWGAGEQGLAHRGLVAIGGRAVDVPHLVRVRVWVRGLGLGLGLGCVEGLVLGLGLG